VGEKGGSLNRLREEFPQLGEGTDRATAPRVIYTLAGASLRVDRARYCEDKG
jgi:hypothetical protein